ncbi:MAG: pilus assembly protein [Burkholderiales bacterium]
MLPYTGHRVGNTRFSIPPIDNFGFARSPEFNPAYFNPSVTYSPWVRPNATTNALEDYPRPSPGATVPSPDAAAPRFNLGAVHEDRTDDTGTAPMPEEMFVVPQGALLPQGTRYYVVRACGGLNTTNNWTTVGRNGIRLSEACEAGISYFPATFYLKTATVAPATYVGGRILATNACGSGCDMYRYEITSTMFGAAAPAMLQQFANWFSFYGDRNRSMIAGLTRSLSGVEDMRIGMFTINSGARACGDATCYDDYDTVNMRDMSSDAEKARLYREQLLLLPAAGGTPNRFAVNHIGRQFQRRTGDNLPVRLSCQKNAGMLFTDGYSNEGSVTDAGNADAAMPAPLRDAHSGTLADIAAKYYLANARPDLLAGNVPVPEACKTTPNAAKLDCRADPHVNFYGITLGARGALVGTPPYVDNPTTLLVNEQYEAAFTNPPAWQAFEDNQPNTVDEIWHATLNARGEYINASTPADITGALRRVIDGFTGGASPSGSIALTGARIGTNTLAVSPFYEARGDGGTDWYSRLTAQTVSAEPTTGVAIFKDVWEASARLPQAGLRNIWFGSNAGAKAFDVENVASLNNLCNNPERGMSRCTGAELEQLGGEDSNGTPTPISIDQAIDYLKGDQKDEVRLNSSGKFRFRTTRLGDIVNSTPVVSSASDDYGYRSLPAPYGAEYGTYLLTGKANRRPMVYAGANDGMLHAFDGRADSAGGIERFAYIPQGVLGHMGNLLFPYRSSDGNIQKFSHRYYVDGPLAVSDAYYDGGWKTALVGATGAGAKGAFALDVSTVSNISGSFEAPQRLWDINSLNTALSDTVRANIGFVLGKPVIVPIKTGSGSGPVKWRAVFGNGYNSASGRAVLFLVDIAPGAPNITMIETVETGAPAGDNGLGNIVAVDRWGPATDNTLTLAIRDGFADTVYAADQKGAIWKFDLRTAAPPPPARPLFTTMLYASGRENGTRQPILGGLTVAAGRGGGVMIYFGTGSFSFDGDGIDTTQQSLYGVLDNNSGTTITPSSLLQQTIGATTTVNGQMTRATSSYIPSYTQFGWFINLPSGERFVGYPRIESGVVFMPTYAPTAAIGCGTNGANWLYGLNALSGAAGLSNVRFDSPAGRSPGTSTGAVGLVTDGTAPVKDVAVLTQRRVTPADFPGGLPSGTPPQCSMVIQVAGAPQLYMPRACGRQSWRQIQ